MSEPSSDAHPFEEVPDESTCDGHDHTVEQIVDYRRRCGVDEYLVKWAQLSETANTWQTEEYLRDHGAGDLVAAYLQREGSPSASLWKKSGSGPLNIVEAYKRAEIIYYTVRTDDGTLGTYSSHDIQQFSCRRLVEFLENHIADNLSNKFNK
jgi:hypothetical protein